MPIEDVDIILKAQIDIPTGNMAYVEFDETAPYVDLSGGGVIDITDFQATFGATIHSKVARLDLFVEIGGVWQDLTVPPDYGSITYVGGLLTTIRWTLNSASITKVKGRIS